MRLLLVALFFVSFVAAAQQAPPLPDLESVPDGPPVSVAPDDDILLPEVTIRRRPDVTIREYRRNGRLYMVQVIPKRGLPYFLLDTDGNGSLDTRYDDLSERIMIPGWVILSW